MSIKGFIKRVVPFFLTFAVGLFIASFFISITAPNFQFNNRSWKKNHRKYDRQREAEIQRLREENMRLRNQMSEKNLDSIDIHELKYAVPPPPPMPPVAPAPPAPFRNR